MKNISINQLIVIFFIGILLFSDFSKIMKNFRDLIKKTLNYKNLKKK